MGFNKPGIHPSILHFAPFFEFAHLPAHLQEISRPFGELAASMAENLTGQECAAGLRKLLEAKDCAVRAALRPA